MSIASLILPRPDEIKGEAIVAFVILKAGNSPNAALAKELCEHVRKTIGPVATPQEVHFVKSLPKTRSGKIMRRVVKAVANGMQSVGDVTTLEDEASVEEVKRAVTEFQEAIQTEKNTRTKS